MKDTQKAAQEYIDRQSRRTHPEGNTDKAGRWYPSENERCKCCDTIREPSRAYPWSLMTHCRSAGHVANLYDVKRNELMKEAKSK